MNNKNTEQMLYKQYPRGFANEFELLAYEDLLNMWDKDKPFNLKELVSEINNGDGTLKALTDDEQKEVRRIVKKIERSTDWDYWSDDFFEYVEELKEYAFDEDETEHYNSIIEYGPEACKDGEFEEICDAIDIYPRDFSEHFYEALEYEGYKYAEVSFAAQKVIDKYY